MRISLPLAALAATLAISGCHSPYISSSVTNRTGRPLDLIELDYPSASFGTQSLAPGATYQYRFKVLGSGPTTLLWTDSSHHNHKATGPSLQENDEGTLSIDVGPGPTPSWNLRLVHPR